MVVRQDQRRRVASQDFLDYFAWMHLRTVDRAAEHLLVVDQSMVRIEEQHREDFVLEAGELRAQISFATSLARTVAALF